jgi:hypothetical protein
MKIHHEKIRTIAEMNVNAIRLYLQGDGRSATNMLIQAMRSTRPYFTLSSLMEFHDGAHTTMH